MRTVNPVLNSVMTVVFVWRRLILCRTCLTLNRVSRRVRQHFRVIKKSILALRASWHSRFLRERDTSDFESSVSVGPPRALCLTPGPNEWARRGRVVVV